MSEVPQSILAARVTNIRARMIGSLLISLTTILLVVILYATSFSRLEQTLVSLEGQVRQSGALTAEQQATAFTEVDAARRVMREASIAWGLMITAAVVSTSLIGLRSIAEPMERLTGATVRLAAGHLDERVPVEWADEFGRLAAAFNEMAGQLQASYADLEERVAERTTALERRSAQLEATAQVAREAAAIRDVNLFMNIAVRLISERFGFYHAGIFLLDEGGEFAVLQAASSEGGRRMLARGHKLGVGRVGIVGYVAASGQPRIALDVGEDAVFFDNPDLPHTRSEMALPLRVRERTIGVLDVQSTEPAAFSQEDIAVLQTLADLLAVGLENARLLGEAQSSLEELTNLYRAMTGEAWQRFIQSRPGLQQYEVGTGRVPQEAWSSLFAQARSQGQPVRGYYDGEDGRQHLLAIPVKLRGVSIGVLGFHRPAAMGEWQPEEIALAEGAAERVALGLDNVRLLEEARQRAARERLVGEIGARVRASLDPDIILKTTVRELGRALGAQLATVEVTGPGQGDGRPSE